MTNNNPDIIDRLVEAYNQSDARGFADLFAKDVDVYEHPNRLVQHGREEIYAYYVKLFGEYPLNRTKVLHRIVIGDRVMDHEQVTRYPEAEPFDVLAVYELQDGYIKRFDLIRK